MDRPGDFDSVVIGSRLGSVVLGVVMLLGGLVASLLTVVPLLWRFAPDVMSPDIPTSPRPLGFVDFTIFALFGPAAVLLLIASWNAFARAVTGRARDLLQRRVTAIVGWVVLVLTGMTSVSIASDGDLHEAVGFFIEPLLFWWWTRRVARRKPRGSVGSAAVQGR